MVPDPILNANQKPELEHTTRKAIYDFLKSYDKPASLGEIAEGIELPDLAIVHHQLHRLVKVEMVEKIWGTERYRVAGDE
jgi:hypothetical protein